MKYHNFNILKLLSLGFLLTSTFYCNGQLTPIALQPRDNHEMIFVELKKVQNEIISTYEHSVTLPINHYSSQQFNISALDLMDTKFYQNYPEIKHFKLLKGQYHGVLTMSSEHLWATISTPNGIVTIYPDHKGNHVFESVGTNIKRQNCGHEGSNPLHTGANWADYLKNKRGVKRGETFSFGEQRRQYRLAVVCTGEYYQANGNQNTTVAASISSSIAAFNVIYNNELNVNFVGLNPFLYPDPNTDPFDPSGDRTRMASVEVDNSFSSGQYDIGHVFHNHQNGDGWETGGVALKGVVCDSGGNATWPRYKAAGWSGSFNNNGFGWASLACHEIGHMFGADHTFNGTGGSCTQAISSNSSYEIASGTTIMSYNGICDNDQNIPSSGEADNYFHTRSLFQMKEYIENAATCGQTINSSNTAPQSIADNCSQQYLLPQRTPYILKGVATDSENDILTYTWEQYDEDGTGTPTQGEIGFNAANNDSGPLTKCYPPSTSLIRMVPPVSTVLSGVNDPFEVLSRTTREINYQFTVRDNNPQGGAISTSTITLQNISSGPLTVSSPGTVAAGQSVTINWDTGGSESACSKVHITLSIDNGGTFPYVLASEVDYLVESIQITLPNYVVNTTDARLKVECSDNECFSFYNISPRFRITSDCEAPINYLCDVEPQTFEQGDPGLNLDLKSIIGNSIENLTLGITNTSNLGPLITNQMGAPGCNEQFITRFENVRVAIVTSGEYTFQLDTDMGTPLIAIFDADTYQENDPCPSFIAASGTDGGGGFFIPFGSVTAPLEACKEYIITFYNNESNALTQIENIVGPDDIILINSNSNSDYSSTYIAIDETGIIRSVDQNSDFTSLAGGNYTIYSITYKSDGSTPPNIVDPNNFIGSNILNISGENCFLRSFKGKPLEVITGCEISDITLGNQSICDPSTNSFSQEIVITYENPPSQGNISVSGSQFMQSFPIGSSPQIITIQGLESNGEPYSITVNFSNQPSCSLTETDLFIAPENCCPLDVDLGSNIIACDDNLPLLDAGDEGEAYEWSYNGSILTDETESTLIAELSGTYTVTVTSATGCNVSDDVLVNISQTPTVTLPQDTIVCSETPVIIEGEVDFGNPQWIKDGIDIIGETNTSLSISESGQYILVAISPDFCFHDDTINVTFVPELSVDLGPEQLLCADQAPIVLDAGMGGISYMWSKDDTVLINDTQTLSIEQSGIYIVSVISPDGCEVRDSVNVSFFDLSEVDAGEDSSICEGGSIQHDYMATSENYSWFKDGVLYSNQDNPLTIDAPGEYVLEVLNEIGCSITDTVIITEVPSPLVDLGEDLVGCEGGVVILSADITGTYFWLENGVSVGNEEELSVTMAGIYTLVVVNENNCSGTDMVEISFEPGPNLDLGEDISICEGENYTLTAITNVTTLVWEKDGEIIEGETDLMLAVSESGEYLARAEGSNGCIVEDKIVVNVNPRLDTDLGEDRSVCNGESVVITSNVIAQSYSWTFNDFEISQMDQIEISDAGTVKLVVTNEFNCQSSDSININIGDTPTLIVEDSYRMCQGQSIDITAESNGTIFEWIVNEISHPETGPTISIGEMSDVSVIVTNENNCSQTASFTVTVSPSPEVNIGNDTILCPGDQIELDAGFHNTYLWSTGEESQTISIENINNVQESINSYIVTITNSDNCEAVDSIDVTFLPELSPIISSSASGVCDGQPVLLSVTGGTSFSWTDDSGTLTDIVENMATANPLETTTYIVEATNPQCPESQQMDSITIEVFEKGEDVSAGVDECVIIGKSIDLMATGGVSYFWNSDGPFIGATDIANPTVNPEEETIYYVEITDTNGCVYMDSVTICIEDDPLVDFIPVSIITPNDDGSNDNLIFKGLEFYPENKITIYNRWGNIVFEKSGYQQDDRLFDGSNGGNPLAADTYYYILTFDGQTYKSPLTIMR